MPHLNIVIKDATVSLTGNDYRTAMQLNVKEWAVDVNLEQLPSVMAQVIAAVAKPFAPPDEITGVKPYKMPA